jgi:endonuclease/exonuclease/phosphatase family metal-dependent hydrolase
MAAAKHERLPASPPPPAAGTIRIASWNIETLGCLKRPRSRTSHQRQQLARRIKGLGASVLALQEIAGSGVLDELVGFLGTSWRHIHAAESPETSLMDKAMMRIGGGNALLFDTSKVTLRHVERLDRLASLAYPGASSRIPVIGLFQPVGSGTWEFRVIGVHLHWRESAIRAQEGRWIQEVVEALLRSGATEGMADIVVAGDLNGAPGNPPHESLQRNDSLVLVPKRNGNGTVRRGRGVDHFYLTAALAERVRDLSALVVRPSYYHETAAEFEIYSDHYPILLDIPLISAKSSGSKSGAGDR